jgi:DNA-binding transcriptional regulator YhcF (GntR family)
MLPFAVTLTTGESPYRQVVYAATKAVLSGELPPGLPFPSVRELSQELKINPNTAHRIVAALIDDGLLAVRPGIGTVVSGARQTSGALRRALLEDTAERLVVEARRDGVTLSDLLGAIRRHWARTVSRAG